MCAATGRIKVSDKVLVDNFYHLVNDAIIPKLGNTRGSSGE